MEEKQRNKRYVLRKLLPLYILVRLLLAADM